MGADLYMNPPAPPRYEVLASGTGVAVYRWPGEMESGSRCWIRKFGHYGAGGEVIVKALTAAGHRVRTVGMPFEFPDNLSREQMAEIVNPPKPVYKARHA